MASPLSFPDGDSAAASESAIYSDDDLDLCETNFQDNRQHDSQEYSKKELALLPYMPPLLSEDLPPCGLMPQIAYANVVQRIRKMWLLHAKQDPANVPLVPICHQVLKNYLDEAERFPLGTANRTRKREPWRRELVFMYEPRWARYFIFETTMIFERESMTEKGREAHDKLIADSYPIPPSLRIRVEKDENEEMVWNLWRAWHRKKRSTVLTLNLQGSAGVEKDKAEDGKDGLEERQEVKRQKMSLSVE